MGSQMVCFHWWRVGWVPQTIKGKDFMIFGHLKSEAFNTYVDSDLQLSLVRRLATSFAQTTNYPWLCSPLQTFADFKGI